MNIKRVNHIGVVTADMERVKKLYTDMLGLHMNHEEIYEGQSKICFLPVGDSQIELIQSLHPNGKIAQIVAERGEGIHHIAFDVENIDEAIKELKGKGMTMVSEMPKAGAKGSRVVFLNPETTHGVMIELVQPAHKSK